MKQLNTPSYSSLLTRDRQIKSIQELYEYVQNAGGNLPFNPSWDTTGSLAEFCQDVVSDPTIDVSDAYMGELQCSGLPDGMSNGEVRVEIYPGLNGSKLLLLTLVSTNLEPYHWEATYYNNSLSEWRSWITEEEFLNATCYRDVYLGVGGNYSDVMIEGYHHDALSKYQAVHFSGASGYVFVIIPATSNPTVAMSLIEVPMTQTGTITSGDITYKILKGTDLVTGSFDLSLF